MFIYILNTFPMQCKCFLFHTRNNVQLLCKANKPLKVKVLNEFFYTRRSCVLHEMFIWQDAKTLPQIMHPGSGSQVMVY